MFRKAFSFGGLLLLAGALVLVTPGSGQAQHRGGGGHGGGFHAGGFHHDGMRGGGFHHGFNHGGFHHGFNHRGFHHGFNHRGFHHGFNHRGFHHGGFRGGGGWWYPGYSGYYWWYPGYSGYYGASPPYYGSYPYSGYSDYYPNTDSSDSSSPAYDSGYYRSYGDVTSSDTRAYLTVSVPADAEIWIEGTRTTSTGSVREYQSPPLAPGARYTYNVRARWNENGREVIQTQQVEITAGTRVNVQFPMQPTKARTAPSD
jgi:uncharacterized protein (TIGR03000 family)